MKTLTVIGGIEGVGKTSLLGVLKACRTDLGKTIDENSLPINKIVEIENSYIDKGYSFTLESTLIVNHIEAIVQKAKENEYQVNLYYIAFDSYEESIRRLERRSSNDKQSISSEIIKSHFESRFDILIRLLPLCDKCLFFDNWNGFEMIAELKNGALQPIRDSIPSWMTQLTTLAKI